MNPRLLIQAAFCLSVACLFTGCERKAGAQAELADGTGPVATRVEPDLDPSHFKVDHPERFPLATAGEHVSQPALSATGVVNPDVSRQIPVPSLASGRVVELDVRLGDEVKRGQLLFKVRSSDIAGAFSDYRKAVKNEELARVQLDRAKLLFENGAIPKSAFEIAQNAEDNAGVDLETTAEHLKLLGSDVDQPTGIVDVYAPAAGIITDQQITTASGVQALTPPNPLTISDISHVWIVCDVYENDLPQVRLGEYADIHLSAYPDRLLKGRIGNIAPVMDPNIRTGKVRLEVENPGLLRLGMFVTATFHGMSAEKHATVPASAVLHLHDREFVYAARAGGIFQRLEVATGDLLPDNIQEIVRGLQPGTAVVANALVLQNTVEQ